MKIFYESGRGYWLEGCGCIRAGGGYHDMNTSHAVVILNPCDSQGDRIADGTGKFPCLRGNGAGYPYGYVLQHLNPVGVDSFNLCTTGDIGRTLTTSGGGLNEHIPVVLCERNSDESGVL